MDWFTKLIEELDGSAGRARVNNYLNPNKLENAVSDGEVVTGIRSPEERQTNANNAYDKAGQNLDLIKLILSMKGR
jgi:hypothetical protein